MTLVQTTAPDLPFDIDEPLAVENAGYYNDVNEIICKQRYFLTYLMIYVRSGRFDLCEDKTDYSFDSGSLVVMQPKKTYSFKYHQMTDNEYYFIHFGGTLADEMVECIFEGEKGIFIGDRPDIADFYVKIVASYNSERRYDAASTLMLKGLLYAVIAGKNRKRFKEYGTLRAVSECVAHIQNNYQSKITVEDLSKMCSLSRYYLMRKFREITGSSVHDYIIATRINAAKRLLLKSTLSISETAEAVGYSDSMYFGRAFKAYTGMSPTEFKNSP